MCLRNKRLREVNLESHGFSMRKKKRSWFSLVKSLFVPEPNSRAQKKSKWWKWVFGGVRPENYPTLVSVSPQRLINQAREEQRKQAMAVAIATAAAAQAAMAAAKAAAEVVQLTGIPRSFQEYEKRIQNSAAIKIQAAYRAHLARKALKALKGLVKLQAMVRGRIVRRTVIPKLKCLPPISKSQSQVQELRVPNERFKDDDQKNQFLSPKEELAERNTSQLGCKSQKNWDYRLLFPKEDMEALWLQKQDAAAKRECMKKYSYSHRERRNYQNMGSGRWSNQLDPRVDSESCRRRELNSTASSNPMSFGVYGTTQMMKQRNLTKQNPVGEMNSQLTLPRRSFSHVKHKSIGDESSLPNSPIFPTYMAATESTKAKERSFSTPKQRLGIFDNITDYHSPYKLRLSSWSSFDGESVGKNGGWKGNSSHISLGMKGLFRD
ncbi:protein IQ-DOMAIN 12 isoform X1 [Rhododendron vialii]|uniref:protein IQ-DOMAIN 12 isoform X1 n=1 Tax=Rhododendron vialii TaxID=182163 RepID=UPI0026600FC5|nr:protein IQ-DOMAIN 12 isoform X1 [Rhododendron vialii]XP_058204464.1 protein IQ-DOMAIN 12 isoform X1 [Rhododendron vialii]XP_058204465.1 protein IQ-DOMAIN 12 isoform X1 [Rhododendron vialii]XP_058204466.1 protein IQ-DOMAIN 12 isoform X1 [Rhododendron vialii]